MYQEQRFLSETEKVLSHLMMAQDLMLINDADVLVRLSRDSKDNLQIWLEVEKPFKDSYARLLERKVSLQAIRSFDFEPSQGRGNELVLRFSLGKMSQGVLSLFEGDQNDTNKRKFFIELTGYPKTFKGTPKEIENSFRFIRSKSEKSATLYPVEVYEKLYEDPNQEKETL